MKCIHTMLVYADSHKSVYATFLTDCRWTNKALGHWRGKELERTGASITTTFSEWDLLRKPELRAELDALARAEAIRLNLPAGPDVFPFGGMS